VRPYEMNIIAPDNAGLRGTIRRVHGIGPARRVEIAIGSADSRIVEIDAPRSHQFEIGQPIGLAPRQYRLFAAAE
jgi:sulfate transport system ATP-binding protein